MCLAAFGIGSIIAALFVAGCASVPATRPAPAVDAPSAPAAAAVATDDNLNAVLWVQRSTEYQANAISLYRAATARLDASLLPLPEVALEAADRALERLADEALDLFEARLRDAEGDHKLAPAG